MESKSIKRPLLILIGHSQGRPSHPSRAPGLTRITLAAGMQFLEKGLSGLETAVHKVDALAAKVAVERGAAREAEPDELADDPNSFETADALRSLASRLGDWTSPEGGVETEATLHGVLAELEAAQATRDAAVRRRDDAETRLAEEIAVRDREEADALESASTIERELERERAAHAMTRSAGESRERGIRDESGEYDGMLEGVVQLTKEREHEALEAEAAASAAKELERGLTREAQDAEDAAQRAEDAAARGEAMDDTLDASLKVSTQERENDVRERLERIKSEVHAAEEEASRLERSHRRSKETREGSTKKEPPHKETREDRRRNHARRMGDVEAQLSRKRAQVATMTKEKVDLEHKLAGVLAMRGGTKGAGNGARGGAVGSVGARVGGLKRRGGSYPAGVGGIGDDFPDTPGRVGFRSRVTKVTRRVDELSVFAGRHLRRSGGWRSAVIVYVLSLHSLAFIVLAIRAMSAPGPTK